MDMTTNIRLGSLASFVAVTIFSTPVLAQQPKSPTLSSCSWTIWVMAN
jgi:hypothetical protein